MMDVTLKGVVFVLDEGRSWYYAPSRFYEASLNLTFLRGYSVGAGRPFRAVSAVAADGSVDPILGP